MAKIIVKSENHIVIIIEHGNDLMKLGKSEFNITIDGMQIRINKSGSGYLNDELIIHPQAANVITIE